MHNAKPIAAVSLDSRPAARRCALSTSMVRSCSSGDAVLLQCGDDVAEVMPPRHRHRHQ